MWTLNKEIMNVSEVMENLRDEDKEDLEQASGRSVEGALQVLEQSNAHFVFRDSTGRYRGILGMNTARVDLVNVWALTNKHNDVEVRPREFIENCSSLLEDLVAEHGWPDLYAIINPQRKRVVRLCRSMGFEFTADREVRGVPHWVMYRTA